MQSSEVFPPDPLSQTCTICLLPIEYPLCKLVCDHIYCFDCIQEWCKTHETCPLCSQSVRLGIKYTSDSEVSEVVFEKLSVERELSLDCLDHGYFKQEIGKLLRICYELEVSRFKQRNSKGTPGEWRGLQNIRNRIETLKLENEAFVRFEAQSLLDEVYVMEEDLDSIKNGVYREKTYQEAAEHDYSDEEEYYDD